MEPAQLDREPPREVFYPCLGRAVAADTCQRLTGRHRGNVDHRPPTGLHDRFSKYQARLHGPCEVQVDYLPEPGDRHVKNATGLGNRRGRQVAAGAVDDDIQLAAPLEHLVACRDQRFAVEDVGRDSERVVTCGTNLRGNALGCVAAQTEYTHLWPSARQRSRHRATEDTSSPRDDGGLAIEAEQRAQVIVRFRHRSTACVSTPVVESRKTWLAMCHSGDRTPRDKKISLPRGPCGTDPGSSWVEPLSPFRRITASSRGVKICSRSK